MRREIKSVTAGAVLSNASRCDALDGAPGFSTTSYARSQTAPTVGGAAGWFHKLQRALTAACALWPLTALAQEEGPREVQLPNPMGIHTWFIILALGAFLAWCISYVLELQKERMSSKPQRESLLRQKDELLNRLTELESQKEAGTINAQRYEKEYRKARSRLSDVLSRLGRKQDSTET